MKPFDEMPFHPDSEKLVNILCTRAQNDNPQFFRVTVAYYLTQVASMMHANIATLDRGTIPINTYVIALSKSGTGKGVATNFMEETVLEPFYTRFKEETFPSMAKYHLPRLSHQRASRKQSDPDTELSRLEAEFENLGPFVTNFDSATVAALKQARHKVLLAQAGSLNLQIDEVGEHLSGSNEELITYLEMYDVGRLKQKLVKSTTENRRFEAIDGRTPANLLLYGTPDRLLDGSKTEDDFYNLLTAGYARRCIFSYTLNAVRNLDVSPEDVLKRRLAQNDSADLSDLICRLEQLADVVHANKTVVISEAVTLKMIEYQLICERAAEELPEHEELRRNELIHRYFKAWKLAGVYAIIDGLAEITEEHLYYAIRLVEESGKAFENLLNRDRPYVKLAKYIAAVRRNVTQADLVEDLPFYRGSKSQKDELMQLAVAYGYQNNILIKKSFNEGIEFLRGETLDCTDLDNIRVSYSTDLAIGYKDDTAPFDALHKLTQASGMHWTNHHLKDGHRQEENAIPGFNIIVLDVENSVSMGTAKVLLKDYKALFYTTRRHTKESPRFRVILPTNYELRLDSKDYKEFMNNLFEWLPFDVDTQTGQRARKWLSHNGTYEYQDGELFDVLPFIPKTTRNEQRKNVLKGQQQLDNLERWVINNTGDGNRNNQLMRYAMILVDAGYSFDDIRQRVLSLNSKIADRLDEAEIMSTIMVTTSKAIAKRDAP